MNWYSYAIFHLLTIFFNINVGFLRPGILLELKIMFRVVYMLNIYVTLNIYSLIERPIGLLI